MKSLAYILFLSLMSIQTLAQGDFTPGFYEFRWEAKELTPAGIYLYRLSFEDGSIDPAQKRVIIQK